MAQEIGKVSEVSGSFFIKNPEGNISILKNGDIISDGDIVLGSGSNSGADKIRVLLADNSKTITISGNEEQLFDETMLSSELSSETVFQDRELNELLSDSINNKSEELTEDNQLNNLLAESLNNNDTPNNQNDVATLTLDDIENLDAAAAGAETPTDTELLTARLEDRTGAEVDVNTDLREATLNTTPDDTLVEGVDTITAPDAVLTLFDVNTSEGSQGSVVSASLDQTPLSSLEITLSNGAVLTFGTTYVPGTIVNSTPFSIQDDDAYIDAESYNIVGTSFVGGGFNSLISNEATVNISDTINTTTVEVTTSDVTENDASVTFNFQTSNAPDSGVPSSLTVQIAGEVGTRTVTLDASGAGSLTIATQDMDPYVDPDSITATVTSINGGNFEDTSVTGATATAQIADVDDTTVLTINETLNNDSTYTYTAVVTNTPDTSTPLVVTLEDGTTITITNPDTSSSVTLLTQVNSVTSVTGGNYEDLDVIYGFGQNAIMAIDTTNNEINDIDLNISKFDSDDINTQLGVSSINLTPEVDADGFAININGEKLTSTDNLGQPSETVYYIKYETLGSGEVNAIRADSSGNIVSPQEVVFTITPNVSSESYSIALGDYTLDGAGHTLINIFDQSGSLGGGNAHSLLFNIDQLYVLATTTDSSGSAGTIKGSGAFDPYTVNYSSGNGMGVNGGNSLGADEVLYLNFTDSTLSTQMQDDLLVDTDQYDNTILNSIDNRVYAQNNAKYLSETKFTFSKWGSGDQAEWKAFNGDVLVSQGIQPYVSSNDILTITSEVTNISTTNANWSIVNGVLTNTGATNDTETISYSIDGGATIITASISLNAGDSFDFNSYNEIQFTANAGDFAIDTMSATGTEKIAPENQVINVEVETSDGTATATGNMQITFDGDKALVGTDEDEVFDYSSATSIDGGAGSDELVLSLNDGNIDFSALNNPEIKNIESINLDEGNHSLTKLSLDDVIQMTDSTDKTLVIKGDLSDSVELKDTTGTWATSSTQIIDNVTYDVYTNTDDSTYKVLIQTDIVDTIV
ncbi:immunoglobulin-like domain-containing protein [Arcobacter sp. YIC-464]|uniref:immunoglobulin-like domain-containing protein n=1 Tax=Arcobacter sp. YIC-464 TaxID=3376631 RepID=UPI003C18D400